MTSSNELRRFAMIRHLVAEARSDRRRRRRVRFEKPPVQAVVSEGKLRRRATMLVERLLNACLPDIVDCSRYFEVLVGRQQMASDVIATAMASVKKIEMDRIRARALAVALIDLINFAESGVPVGGKIGTYLAAAIDGDRLIIGLGFDGAYPVAPKSATHGLLRARAIVQLLHGDFQRGFDCERMVFGLTFPRSIVMVK